MKEKFSDLSVHYFLTLQNGVNFALTGVVVFLTAKISKKFFMFVYDASYKAWEDKTHERISLVVEKKLSEKLEPLTKGMIENNDKIDAYKQELHGALVKNEIVLLDSLDILNEYKQFLKKQK